MVITVSSPSEKYQELAIIIHCLPMNYWLEIIIIIILLLLQTQSSVGEKPKERPRKMPFPIH